jgi:hypothetical protein
VITTKDKNVATANNPNANPTAISFNLFFILSFKHNVTDLHLNYC